MLFNDDLEVISSEWLTAMLEYSQEPDVGAVGAKLLYPDGRLQHVGIVLGVAGVAAHAFHQHPGVSPGYGGSAMMARNYSAVTAACMMTRRAVFDEVGGSTSGCRPTSTTSTTACACGAPATASCTRRGPSSITTNPPASAPGSTTWASSARCAGDGPR